MHNRKPKFFFLATVYKNGKSSILSLRNFFLTLYLPYPVLTYKNLTKCQNFDHL